MKLALSGDIRRIDALAAGRYGLGVGTLMERAGEAAARAAWRRLGSGGRRVGLFCGKGNNGGDAFAAARGLKRRRVPVTVFMAFPPEALGPECARQYAKARAAGVPLRAAWKPGDLPAVGKALAGCGLLVDGLLGTGLSRKVTGQAARIIELLNRSQKPVLALDAPSGFSTDRGIPLGAAVKARWTVTFGLSKPGFYLPGASAYTGEVTVADLGLPRELLTAPFLSQELTDAAMVEGLLPRYGPSVHKGTRGRVLVVAGSLGLTGAAALSAWGAQRIGAGLVTVACPESLNPILAVKLTECMTAPLPEGKRGHLTERSLGRLLQLAQGMDALVVGPGLGRHPSTGKLLAKFLPRLKAPVVLDADALYHLAARPRALRGCGAPKILTPHSGEAARLLGVTASRVEAARLDIAKQMAAGYNGVALLKGPHTLIARPDGALRVNPTGDRGLATGGTGDVLSGILGGLLAQKLAPFDAAAVGAYLHGLAGQKAGQALGPDGLMAGDLLPILPRLLKAARNQNLE